MERKCISVMLRIVLLHTIISSVYCDCGLPPNIPNSMLKNEFQGITTFSPGSPVKYECHPGYTAKPGAKNVIYCQKTSTWSSYEEFCTLKRCPNPGDIENGFFEAESFFFGARVNYFCDPGYRMKSKNHYRDCLADRTWSNTKPYCDVVVCPPPPTIPHGSFYPVKEEYQYQDAVIYTCNDPNALMKQDNSLFCTETGTWSDTEPRCIELFCPDPKLENGTIISGNKTDGSYDMYDSITLACDQGYRIRGQRKLTCGEDFQWKPKIPSCELGSYCPEPSLENGIVASGIKPDGSYDTDHSITLRCNPGYKLNGNERLTCGANYQWNKAFPVCEKRSYCPEPSLENGIIASGIKPDGSYDARDSITMRCNSGYKLNGNERLTCGSNFQWKEAFPVCEKEFAGLYCPAPHLINGKIKEGKKSDGSYSHGSKVTMECNKDYELNGKEKLTCGRDLQWEPQLPICQLKNGCKPPVIKNGRVIKKNNKAYNPEEDGYGFSEKDDIAIMCDEGYEQEGIRLLICLKEYGFIWSSYVWSSIPVCKEKRSFGRQ